MVTNAAAFLLLLDNPRYHALGKAVRVEHMVDQHQRLCVTATMVRFLPSAAKRQNLPFRYRFFLADAAQAH
jgi:hypothetical protein